MELEEKIRLELVREALSFPLERFTKRDGSVNRAKLRQLEPDFRQDALNFIFIRKAIEAQGVFFGYEEVNFQTLAQLVKIYCPDHKGYFMQTAKSHLAGNGCSECSRKLITRTNDYGSFQVPCSFHKFFIDGDSIVWYNKYNKLTFKLENKDD